MPAGDDKRRWSEVRAKLDRAVTALEAREDETRSLAAGLAAPARRMAEDPEGLLLELGEADFLALAAQFAGVVWVLGEVARARLMRDAAEHAGRGGDPADFFPGGWPPKPAGDETGGRT